MVITLREFASKIGEPRYHLDSYQSDLPCFAHRYSVLDQINTPALITEYIKVAREDSENDVLVFSVTEEDTCWQVWKDYAITHPKTFQVVQGGSGHGNYQCRMYIYTKPKSKRRHGI